MSDANPYDQLGIRPDATPEEIRAAFRRAVRRRHPDTSPATTDDTAVRNVIDAYRLLADPKTRASYDATHEPSEPGDGTPRKVRTRYTSPRKASPTATAPCANCDGTGVVRSITTCPTCRGRAEITAIEATRARVLRCRTCQGAGQVRSRQMCERCGGTGTAAATDK